MAEQKQGQAGGAQGAAQQGNMVAPKVNLKGTLRNYYRKPGGGVVFVYLVSGPAGDIKLYEEAQGTNLRHDNESKAPLFFSPRSQGKQVSLIITPNGRVVVDDLNQVLADERLYQEKLIDYRAQFTAQRLFANQGRFNGGIVNNPGMSQVEDEATLAAAMDAHA